MFEEYISHKVFHLINKWSVANSTKVYVIGGFVRDLIMGNVSKDVDIVVEGSGIDLAAFLVETLKVKHGFSVFKNFGTAHFKYDNIEWEFVGARKESYNHNSRNPQVEQGTIAEDQMRRDFTINALAISLGNDFGTLLDPFGGIRDIDSGIIRTPLAPIDTFNDDPLRMLRAVRFAHRFGFDIDDIAFEAMKKLAKRISIVAPERISEELNKMLLCDKPSIAIRLLYDCNILNEILPSIAQLKGVQNVGKFAHKDNFNHSLAVLDNLSEKSDNLWLRWAALLHDIGKAPTKKFVVGHGWTFHGHEVVGAKMVKRVFQDLHLPQNEKMLYVQKLVSLHLRPIALVEDIVTDSAVRRLLFDAGNDIDDLMVLAEADITSGNKEKVRCFLSNFTKVRQKLIEIENKDKIRNWQPPITGEIIMETFGIPPSFEVGVIKNSIREAILDGVIPNTEEDAFNFMINKGLEMGLVKKI